MATNRIAVGWFLASVMNPPYNFGLPIFLLTPRRCCLNRNAPWFLGSKAPLAMTLFFIAFMTFIFFMTFMAFIASRHDGASPRFVDQMYKPIWDIWGMEWYAETSETNLMIQKCIQHMAMTVVCQKMSEVRTTCKWRGGTDNGSPILQHGMAGECFQAWNRVCRMVRPSKNRQPVWEPDFSGQSAELSQHHLINQILISWSCEVCRSIRGPIRLNRKHTCTFSWW